MVSIRQLIVPIASFCWPQLPSIFNFSGRLRLSHLHRGVITWHLLSPASLQLFLSPVNTPLAIMLTDLGIPGVVKSNCGLRETTQCWEWHGCNLFYGPWIKQPGYLMDWRWTTMAASVLFVSWIKHNQPTLRTSTHTHGTHTHTAHTHTHTRTHTHTHTQSTIKSK